MLSVEHIAKTYTGTADGAAVKDVSFTVDEGRFYTLLGPSGCGKTTTLRMIAGLERPDRGRIAIGDRRVSDDGLFVPPHRRDIGMVFQSYAVWPHMTVFQNVAFPLRMSKPRPSRAEIERAVREALALVDLEAVADRPAPMLSGGQQQRVALARALVRKPKLLLLDEPLSNLDAKLRERMRTELRELQRRLRITTVYVTHDQSEALFLSRRIGVMQAGHLVQEGTPLEIYGSPGSPFVADFVGSAALLPGEIVPEGIRVGIGVVRCAVPPTFPVGSSALLALREEHISVARERDDRPNQFEGALRVAAFLGDHQQCSVVLGDALVRGRAPAAVDLHAEKGVWVHVPPEHCVLIPDDGWRPRAAALTTADAEDDGD